MGAQLASTVYVKDPDTHQTVRLEPGTCPEPRLAALVTNPAAWVDGKLPRLPKAKAEDPPPPPPRGQDPKTTDAPPATDSDPDGASGDGSPDDSGDGDTSTADTPPTPPAAKKTAARKTAAPKAAN
ncbi:hypothetical protein [Streptomyces sp. NPDC059076]|uniref:hypothetical protein n=1 Tax=unclassified Streptomyces TaxID=2593676 RepID=UPI00369AF000